MSERVTEKQKECDHRFADGDRDSPPDWCVKCYVDRSLWERHIVTRRNAGVTASDVRERKDV